jgi:hypothetical protein
MVLERRNIEEKGSFNEKVGLFSRKSPTFGVWLPIVDEIRTFEGIFDETGTDSWK